MTHSVQITYTRRLISDTQTPIMNSVGLCVMVFGCCVVAAGECRSSYCRGVRSEPRNRDWCCYVEGNLRVQDFVANLSVASAHLGGKSGNRSPSELASIPSAWSFYLPVLVNATSPCGLALQAMLLSLADHSSSWAVQMIDSWGKYPDGFLSVGLRATGVFDECVSVQSREPGGARGKFCNIAYSSAKGHGKENGPAPHDMTPLLGAVSGTVTPVMFGVARRVSGRF